MTVDDLYKLYDYLIPNNKLGVEFSDEEVKKINNYIIKIDTDSLIKELNNKYRISKVVDRDYIHDKVDNVWQFVMDRAYEKFDDGISREEFINRLSEYEKVAVIFGNFNYQVENGGLLQWADNGYKNDLNYLEKFVDNSDFVYKMDFQNIFGGIRYIDESIKMLNDYDEWYEQDKQTRIDSLKDYDKLYNKISENWKNYLEDYLIDNMPDEYMDLIKTFNHSNIAV